MIIEEKRKNGIAIMENVCKENGANWGYSLC